MRRPPDILSLHHVPFEGLGSLDDVIRSGGHRLRKEEMWRSPSLPDPAGAGAPGIVIVMGGPMGIGDTESHPWLPAEKEFIRRAIDSGKTMLGICLGAQLIAEALGGEVASGPEKEIGWFPVTKDAAANDCAVGRVLPEAFECFHWHGDAFTLPAGAVPLGRSGITPVQGFVYEERIAALQFHLEATPPSAKALAENCRNEILAGGPFVQTERSILENEAGFSSANRLMEQIWEVLANLNYT